MERLNKRRITTSLAVVIVVVTLVVIVAVLTTRRQKAVEALVKMTKSLSIGSSLRSDYENQTGKYRRYKLQQEITVDGKPQTVIRFLIPGEWGSHTLVGVSANFADGRLVSRSIGLLREGCCSVEVDQSLFKKQLGAFQRSNVVRRTTGNSNYVVFDVSPDIAPSERDRMLNFSPNCLLPFSQCTSVDQLNPAISEMEKASDRAGS